MTTYLVVRSVDPDVTSVVPVRAFATREAAEAFRDERFLRAARTMNPFHREAVEYFSDEAREKLTALGLPLPLPVEEWYGDWSGWWDACQERVTDEQRLAVWTIVAPPLYEVRAVEDEEP